MRLHRRDPNAAQRLQPLSLRRATLMMCSMHLLWARACPSHAFVPLPAPSLQHQHAPVALASSAATTSRLLRREGAAASEGVAYTNSAGRAQPSFLRKSMKMYNNHNDDDSSNEDEAGALPPGMARALQPIRSTPASKSLTFSALMTLCGAALGPFLDSYHSLFGVLSYEQPLTAHLWGSGSSATPDLPALVTAWWVPELFGLAGFIIGWLYIVLDAALVTPTNKKSPPWPLILAGISFFTLQYWLSGVMYANDIDRTTILNAMSVLAALGFAALDLTEAGFWTSLATAVGGPAIECGLITVLVGHGGYHYNDLGETGYFPLWIVPVYFLGGPAVGNLARGFWQVLPGGVEEHAADITIANAGNDDSAGTPGKTEDGPRCNVCNDSRAVGCPNCDALGYYITYGRKVTCPACKGRGLVICRDCFSLHDEDPADIEAIREKMRRMPD